ncbi:MAG: 30S ribosomal protein S6, partial [Patescibacteria group bacterium]|nr:30S ribosomal protein S6 [Patescibacteria group bacterium]
MEQTDKKTYEISFLAKGEEAVGAVIGYLKEAGAEITSEQQIEQIELAYPINKHNNAHFGCVHFELDPGDIDAIKDALKFEDNILRYLIITPPIAREEAPQPRRGRAEGQEFSLERRPVTPPEGGTISNEDLEAKLE